MEPDTLSEFETKFAKLVGSRYAIAVNSGTSGLAVCMFGALNNPGESVVTTPMTFPATSNAILLAGGVPLFADVDTSTLCIDSTRIKATLDSKSVAVLGVDLYGYPFASKEILELCKKEGLYLFEDAAQALGSSRSNARVGSISDATIFSFFETKHLPLGEGGMITTNDRHLAERFRIIRTHGQDRRYHQVTLGFNFRLPQQLARAGLEALKTIDNVIRRRNQIARIYEEQLSGIQGVTAPYLEGGVHSYYMYPVVVKSPDREIKALERRISKLTAISIGRGYGLLVYQQPFYRNLRKIFWGAKVMDFPDYSQWHCRNAEWLVDRIIELPTTPALTDEQVLEIASTVKSVIGEEC